MHDLFIFTWLLCAVSFLSICSNMLAQLTEDAISVALSFATELHSPSFRVGYNSLGAFASVNHLHFQIWSFDLSPDKKLPLERANLGIIIQEPIPVYEVLDYPINAVAFDISGPKSKIAPALIYMCISYLLIHGIPHNLLINQELLYILPRVKATVPPFHSLPGFPELSGEVILLNFDEFGSLDAELVWEVWRKQISLPKQDFQLFRNHCITSTLDFTSS